MDLTYAKDSLQQQPYMFYLEQYLFASPQEISSRVKVPYYETIHAFRFRFLECLYEISYPDFTIRHLDEGHGIYPLEQDVFAKILVLRYFLEGCADDSSGNMMAYQDLPCGDIYLPQFRVQGIDRLARQFGGHRDIFRQVMESIHGVPMANGDHAYQIELFHGLYLCLILWDGDEELPPSAQILFSDNFPMAFTAEDAAQAVTIVLDYLQTYQTQVLRQPTSDLSSLPS